VEQVTEVENVHLSMKDSTEARRWGLTHAQRRVAEQRPIDQATGIVGAVTLERWEAEG
jgi:hypothetical protein